MTPHASRVRRRARRSVVCPAVFVLEDRLAPAATVLSASSAAVLQEFYGSTAFTQQVDGTSQLSVRKFNFTPPAGTPVDERSVLEFNTQGITPDSFAGGTLRLNCIGTTSSVTTVQVYGFADNGTIGLDDATSTAVPLGSFSPTSTTAYTISLDNPGLTSLLQAGTGYVGILLVGVPNDNVQFAGPVSAFGASYAPALTLQVTPPSVSVGDVTVNEGSPANFNVTLSRAMSTPVSVAYTTVAGGAPGAPFASPYTDFVPQSGTLTFSPGQTSLPVSVPTVGDPASDSGEQFTLSLSNPTAGVTLGRAAATATIQDVPNPTPGVSVGNVTLNEPPAGTTAPATFTVSLTVPSTQTVTVTYATADGTAKAGTDYTATGGTLSFSPGQTSKTVSVPVIGGDAYEYDETFTLNLTGATNAVPDLATGTGTIKNVVPSPAVWIADTSVVKPASGTANAVFTLTLSNPSTLTTYVNWSTANGTALAGVDYQAQGNSLSFPPGVTTGTISVPVFGDTFTEGNRTFLVNLQSPGTTVIGRGTATATIIDASPTSGTMTFPAVSWGYAEDINGDGTFDSFSTGDYSTPIRKYSTTPVASPAGPDPVAPPPNLEDRSIYEFDVSRVVAGVVSSVTFSFDISSYVSNGGAVNVDGFVGTGTASLADATAPAATLASYLPNQLGVVSVTLDRAQVLALTAGSRFLGLRLDSAASYVNTSIFSPIAGPADAPTVTFHADLPVASADAYSTPYGTALAVPATAGVLANDFAPAGMGLTALPGQSPAHGSLTLNADGSFSYTPASGFSGTDTFTYEASDGPAQSGPATVTITVNPPSTSATVTTVASSANPSRYATPVTFTATVAASASGLGTPTGVVQFKVDNTPLGSPVPVAGGVAVSPAVSTLAPGAHAVTATFTDASGTFQASTGTLAGGQKVVAATATALSASATSAVYGQPVTFSAAVTNLDTTNPVTGSVTFYDGTRAIGTAVLSGGVGSFTSSALAPGAPHAITATFNGTSLLARSTSSALSLTVSPAATTVSLTDAAGGPVVYGVPVVLSATVAGVGTSAVPTGTVRFYSGATLVGTAMLKAGTASVTVTLPVGAPDSLTASYAGSANFLAGTSAVFRQQVDPAPTSTALTSLPVTVPYGSAVTLSARVTNVGSAAAPTGQVSFLNSANGGAVVGRASVAAGGSATFTTSRLVPGTYEIVASYAGTASFAPSGSDPAAPLAVTVRRALTAATLTSSASSFTYGQAVSFTASLANTDTYASGTKPVPTGGSVTFYLDYGTPAQMSLGAVALTNGKAVLTTKLVPAGSHSVTGVYAGTVFFQGAGSNAVGATVSPAGTAVSLTSSASGPVTYGTPVTFTAAVTDAATGLIPVGPVQFWDGTVLLGTVNLNGLGSALLTHSLALGAHSITARYVGTSNFTASTSTAVSLNIT